MLFTVLLALVAAATPPKADAQNTLLDQGYHNLYNLDFAAAHGNFQEWGRQHPDDPMAPVSDAAGYLYAEFDRLRVLQSELFTEDNSFFKRQRELKPDKAVKGRFEEALGRAQ